MRSGRIVIALPRVKPEGMLFGKPLHTFPDHALGVSLE
jgi:hypothetical protein